MLLERFSAGHHHGSSHGGSRIFRLGYPDPAFVRMGQEALPLWRELEDDAGEPLLDTTGALDHGAPTALDTIVDAYDTCGAAYERIPPDAAHERWPGMRFETEVVSQPDGGRCRADVTLAALQRRARDLGAAVHHDVGVASANVRGDGVEVVAAERSWSARVAVMAVGAWTNASVPLRVTQEQVQHFAPLDATHEWPSFIHHRDPLVYGLLAPGEGVKVDVHHGGVVVDPDDRPPRDLAREAAVVRYVEDWFPGLDPTPIGTAECLYTSTADESFVFEERGPVVTVSACSGHGFKFTPLLGQRIAAMAMKQLTRRGGAR